MNQELVQQNNPDTQSMGMAQQGPGNDNSGGLTPDESAASLAFVTNLSQHFMPKNQNDTSTQPPPAVDSASAPSNQTPITPPSEPIPVVDTTKQDEEKLKMFKEKLDTIVKEVTTSFEKKLSDSDKQTKKIIEGIKGEIKTILNG